MQNKLLTSSLRYLADGGRENADSPLSDSLAIPKHRSGRWRRGRGTRAEVWSGALLTIIVLATSSSDWSPRTAVCVESHSDEATSVAKLTSSSLFGRTVFRPFASFTGASSFTTIVTSERRDTCSCNKNNVKQTTIPANQAAKVEKTREGGPRATRTMLQ